MSEYTSTREGFQRCMTLSLTGKPEDTQSFADALVEPSFYHLLNGERVERAAWCEKLVQMRSGMVEDWKVDIHEFLRDGDQLATHITGVLKMGGKDNKVESFVFAQVDPQSGKIKSMVERAVM